MSFFADPSQYTHAVRFVGFPAYYRDEGGGDCVIEGTNVVWEWCIFNIGIPLYKTREWLRQFVNPEYESPDTWNVKFIRRLHAEN